MPRGFLVCLRCLSSRVKSEIFAQCDKTYGVWQHFHCSKVSGSSLWTLHFRVPDDQKWQKQRHSKYSQGTDALTLWAHNFRFDFHPDAPEKIMQFQGVYPEANPDISACHWPPYSRRGLQYTLSCRVHMYLRDIKTEQVQIHHAGWCSSQVSALVLSLVQHLKTKTHTTLRCQNHHPSRSFMQTPQRAWPNFRYNTIPLEDCAEIWADIHG